MITISSIIITNFTVFITISIIIITISTIILLSLLALLSSQISLFLSLLALSSSLLALLSSQISLFPSLSRLLLSPSRHSAPPPGQQMLKENRPEFLSFKRLQKVLGYVAFRFPLVSYAKEFYFAIVLHFPILPFVRKRIYWRERVIERGHERGFSAMNEEWRMARIHLAQSVAGIRDRWRWCGEDCLVSSAVANSLFFLVPGV